MTDKIDLSLDDIIALNRKNGAAGGTKRGRGGRGTGWESRNTPQPRMGPIRSQQGGNIKPSPYTRPKDNLHKGGAVNGDRSSNSVKLILSNIYFGVTDADIKELFAEFGPLKKAAINYDHSGRSLGTAEVVFERQADALQAMKQYNNVPLDGRLMKIKFCTSLMPDARRRTAGRFKTRGGGRESRAIDNNDGLRKEIRGRDRGGQRKGYKMHPTAEVTDAELDAYIKLLESAGSLNKAIPIDCIAISGEKTSITLGSPGIVEMQDVEMQDV